MSEEDGLEPMQDGPADSIQVLKMLRPFPDGKELCISQVKVARGQG